MKRSADATFDIPEASPSSISLPSPEAQSPASLPSEAGPSRKRARSDLSPEERKEARAHRNRIAAQNSRDRRKAQFSFLERRVAELEEENRQLKASMGLTQLRNPRSEIRIDEQNERENAREKENEELRERIKTLENGWDAVVKALAASGLPLQIPTPPASNTESSSSSSNPQKTFQVMIPPSPTFPLTPESSSNSSPNSERDLDEFESTRHLARVATTDAPPLSSLEFLTTTPTLTLPSTDIDLSAPAISQSESPADEALMQDLFREILAASPTITPSALPPTPTTSEVTTAATLPAPSMAPVASTTATGGSENWDSDIEMQKLLDMLPGVQPDSSNAVADLPSALDLEMCGWDMGQYLQTPSSSIPLVGVF